MQTQNLHTLKELAKDLVLLYVEDNEKMREQASAFFKKFFKKTVIAKDGNLGFIAYEQHKPHIIVTDVSMPILNGLDMVKKIKSLNPNIKIIITSSYDDKNKLLQAIELGVFKYLKKPIAIDTLIIDLIECIESIKIQDEHSDFEEYVQKIFNSQTNLLLFFKKRELKVANHLFLDFFKVDSIYEFNEKYGSLGEQIVKRGDYIYDDESGTWFDKIISDFTRFFNILIIGPDNEIYHFLVSANRVPDSKDEIIISLSDITGLSFAQFDTQNDETIPYTKNEKKSLLNIFEIIKSKHQEVTLLSFYKGLNIVNAASIQKIYEDSITVKTDYNQIKAASLEKTVILRSPMLSRDLKCRVINFMPDNYILVLGSFEEMPRSPSQRGFPRLSPTNGMKAEISYDSHKYESTLLDLSINSVKIFIPTLPPGTKSKEFIFTSTLSVGSNIFSLKASSKVIRIEEKNEGYEIVLGLILEKAEEQILISYISARQLELIREFKKL